MFSQGADPQARRLAVVHQGRVLALREIPAERPILRVSTPRVEGEVASLAWTASSDAGTPFLSSVFYSSNGGEWFDQVFFEETRSQAEVQLDSLATEHVVKITVTDGSRSSEQLLTLPRDNAGVRK